MYIVIYASGIPFNGNTIKERSLGGSESAAYYVAKELAARGNEVVVFTEDEVGGKFDGVDYVWVGNKTNEAPLGENWNFFCENTPHDVNIVQRHPLGFVRPIRSKVNLFWAHDIALKRNADPILAGLWQVDAFMPVSNWFKNQIIESWEVNPELIRPIANGVDYSAFDQYELKDNSVTYVGDTKDCEITLLYSSRPERGLEHLVRPDGIMEKLAKIAPHVKLKVCGYEHPVPQLDGFYQFLRARIDELPNCEHMGALTKNELYKFMCEEADVWCYPTEFEEVSCITAMEAMAAGLTIMTTNVAALPETIGGYENLIQFNADKGVPEDKFVERIASFNNKFRRRTHRPYTWENTTDQIENIIEDCFAKNRDTDAIARHYLHNSDIVAMDYLAVSAVSPEVWDERKLYDFRLSQEAYADHYSEGTEAMYDGPDFHYEEGFENHPRFQAVANRIIELELKDGARIIDYGCAHGHFTNNLAKMFPQYKFMGVDVSPKAITVAEDKAKEWGLTNVEYDLSDWLNAGGPFVETCSALIIGEILEHVPDINEFLTTCEKVVGKGVACISTTPLGPWEANSYEKEWPTRYHLHHLERQDLRDLFVKMKGFKILCMPAGGNTIGELLGWYICTFELDCDKLGTIDYDRKFKRTVPRQTVSFCAIAKNASDDIGRLIKSVAPYVDEIIVGVDRHTTDDTIEKLTRMKFGTRSPALTITAFTIDSPTDIGFDAARNAVIERATMQWVMWADCDEEFISGEKLRKYLRNNQWRGYGIPQHHFSTEPLGVLSTDMPVRIFRNNENVRFLGVVHEHPECAHLENEGVGYAYVLQELHFSHYGYKTESIRRDRFRRNISLMARDRAENPNRILGKFLWIRDLALMCRFELEQNGMMVSPDMRAQAVSGIELWEDTIDKHGTHKQTQRMIRDHLEFYDTLVNVLDQGFTYRMKLSSGINNTAPELSQVPQLSARFLNRRHLDKFLSVVIDNEVNRYEEKYL